MTKVLSIFIDESGDFGPYDVNDPNYYVAMVFHDQSIDISPNIKSFNDHLLRIGYTHHNIHTGPLIRRESYYATDLMEDRKSLFDSLFNFARRLDIKYACAKIEKDRSTDVIKMTSKLSREISNILKAQQNLLSEYDQIIVYYDNGQIELTKILTSVFTALYSHIEFRKVKPADYKLFQVADLICTIELLADKAEHNSFTNSELKFFGSPKIFKKNYIRKLQRKRL